MGWGFDIFQKFAVKFPAHGQIIVANEPYIDQLYLQEFSLLPFTLIPQ